MGYAILILLAITQIILSVVLSYKKHSRVSRVFTYFSFAVVAWTLANTVLFYATHTASFQDLSTRLNVLNWSNRFGFALGTLTLLVLYRLILTFPVEKQKTRASQFLTGAGLAVMLTAFHPVMSGFYTLTKVSDVPQYVYGTFSNLITAYYVVIAGATIKTMVSELRKSKDQLVRSQTKTILLALILTAGLAVAIIVVIPLITKDDSFIYLGYYTPFILTAAIFYSIFKQGFLDFHALVARAVGYTLTTTTFVVAFVVAAIVATRVILGIEANAGEIFILAVFSVAGIFIMQPLRVFFDRLTSTLFYRDAYETQDVLDKVSGTIVGNVDPHKIQKGALTALAEALKPTYAVFLLHQGNGLKKDDVIGQDWQVGDAPTLQTVLKSAGKKVVVYDELEERQVKLRGVLRSEDISLVSPLVTKEETIGYLVLGPKKSGNIYNSQDVGLLNIASNELAVALQNAQRFEEIQAFNITLQEKVTEATRELKRTNRKLVALDEAKDEFISMASHQLRTPLTSIKGYLSMLIEGDLGKVTKAQEKALKEAFGSSQRMVYLIADFLNVSRIKTGKFVIEPKEVDLPQIVTEEITQLREMASSRDITLEYESPGVFPRVQLDDNKIRQVMMNMVDNAIYYTPAGGKVTIQLYVSGEEVLFKVIDTGIGVPKREQHKLFTKFFRANNAKKARPDGTGLGLFMAQKIIVEQGGAIIFESTEGKGSTFGFRFPLKKIKL